VQLEGTTRAPRDPNQPRQPAPPRQPTMSQSFLMASSVPQHDNTHTYDATGVLWSSAGTVSSPSPPSTVEVESEGSPCVVFTRWCSRDDQGVGSVQATVRPFPCFA
jgi:hypothetical protein